MGGPFFAGLAWLFITGALCLLSAYGLKHVALRLLSRAFGTGFALGLYAMLTLPGFFLHEGSHALAALLLRVPIRGITFIPHHSPLNLSVEAGVQVASTDRLRMALIALAPLLTGTIVLGLLSGALGTAGPDPLPWVRLRDRLISLEWGGAGFWIMLYLMWALGTHMAPSRGDMVYVQGGAVALLVLLLALGLLLSLLGGTITDQVGAFLGRLGDGLFIGTALNGVILLPLFIIAGLLRR